MSAFTGGMDDECPVCKREVGEHTMREFEACSKSRAFNIDYGPASQKTINERFQIPDDVLVADHLVSKATFLEGGAGQLQVVVSGLLLEFGSSATGQVETLAKVLFISDPTLMRKTGKLLRDSCNGAANAAEKLIETRTVRR